MRLSLLGAVAPLVASVAADHLDVTVGKDGKLQFQPEQLTAKVGDTITYRFFASNHSVAQSSFDKPCQPLDKGFFSGFVPTASPNVAAPTTFTITVSDTKPIWVYNGQTNGNCQSGMLHAINPPPDSFAKFKAAAKAASTSPSPAGGPAGGVRKLRVEVGKDGLTFTPNKISEIPGTVLEFGFNARNHTVTQSSFAYPCQPLNKGFSSGFIATTKSPSGAVFQVTLNDTHPVWFYCGQPNGNHCQSGMVGSINADTDGKFTQEGFVQKAKEHAVPSWIPHWAPIGGRVFVDGKEVRDFNLNGGNAIDVDAIQGGPSPPSASGHPGGHPGGKPTGVRVTAAVPKPTAPVPSGGPSTPPTFDHKAGGGKPANYGWADSISDEAVERLYTLSFIEQIIIKLLTSGYDKLARGGAWAGAYPASIVDILGTMGAQRVIHGATTEECLTHYGKPILRECTLKPAANLGQVTGFLHAVKALNALGIGALIDTTTAVAATDPWLVPLVATEIGSKARLAAVINLMQNHTAAPMPREVLVPADLAWSYIMTHFVASCPDAIAGLPAKPYAPILEVAKEETAWRTTSVTVKYDATGHGGQHYVAWMGSYGLTGFTPIHGGKAVVPDAMYGNVWIAVVSNPNVPLGEIGKHIVAGPETVWIKNR